MLLVVLFFSIAYLVLFLYGAGVLPFLGIALSPSLVAWADILKSLVDVLAIIIAGAWTYNRFVDTRERHPYPNIRHTINHYRLADNVIYLSVSLQVKNEGKRKLDLRQGRVLVKRIFPVSQSIVKALLLSDDTAIRLGMVENVFFAQKRRVDWGNILGDRKWAVDDDTVNELEPGQTKDIQFDFIFEEGVKVVEISSALEDRWELVTLYMLND